MGNIQFINAGAGSGKTYTLTKKFYEFLKDGAKPSEFILTTYTKAAADEFRSKIKAKLLEEGMLDVLPLVESARIGTIHSVAQSYIEKYWYLLHMSPSLAVREENEMKAFRNRILDSVVTEKEIVFFNDFSNAMNITKLVNDARKPDPYFWKDLVLELVDKMRLYSFDVSVLHAFKKSSLEIVSEMDNEYVLDTARIMAAAGPLKAYFLKAKREKEWNESVQPFISDQSWDSLLPLWQLMNNGTKWVAVAPQDLFDMVRRHIQSATMKLSYECVEKVFAVAERLFDKIAEYKRIDGVLEFSDLEILFLQLLSIDAVKADLRESIKYVFVDEFQDVSPIQLKIFQTLSDIVQESCWVGDPKQAIYGFRGSDSSLVNSVITSMTKDQVESLENSYRSLPQLVNASNEMFINAFAKLTESERLKKELVRLEPCDKKIAEQEKCDFSYRGVHHWWVSVPTKDGESTDPKKASTLYPAVATKLWTIFRDKTFKVTDTVDDKPVVRDLRYGDVAILTRSNSDCSKIAAALRDKGLPVSVLDETLDKQAEVRLVFAMMKYIARIDEALSVAELRRLLNDEDIETILHGLAKQNDCNDLIQLLDTLRTRYRYHSVYDMVKELIALLDLRHLVSKWSMGQKRQANLDLLVSRAAAFVALQKDAAVIEFINYIADSTVEMPFDNTGDTIKVLTYHKSKGLQWKMVILNSLHKDSLDKDDFFERDFSRISLMTSADGTVNFNVFPPVDAYKSMFVECIQDTKKAKERWDYLMEKKRAEELRLFYVGLTRAENYLVRLSFGAVESKWLDNINVQFDMTITKDVICDDSTFKPSVADSVSSLPYDKAVTRAEGKKKYIVPSQCEVDPAAALPECELIKGIAGHIDIAGLGDRATLFGTCVHNYMAVHRWPSDDALHQLNLRNAERVIAGYGFADLIDAEKLVAQADEFFKYIEEKYGKVETMMHEVPFTHRKDGQVMTGEIDLYIKTETGVSILVDYKNPSLGADVADGTVKTNALKYWPQLDAYSKALCAAKYPVDHVMIFYLMLGAAVKFNRQF
jgi:ATP-dependent exoDNAse (exonuclease V) beta subunit